MKSSALGKSALRVSQLGMGCSHIASLATEQSPRDVSLALVAASDAGVNFFDTADIYGQGDSERMLGRLFSGTRRDRVVYCTKSGLTLDWSQSLIRSVKPWLNPLLRTWNTGRRKATQQRLRLERSCFEPSYLRQSLENSLRRLRTDYIDVFMLHSPSVQAVRRDDVQEVVEQFRREGKIRVIGVSSDDVETAEAALSWAACGCLQVPISLANRAMISTVLPKAAKAGVGIVAREPFAGGLVFEPEQRDAFGMAGLDRAELAREALRYVTQLPGVNVTVARMNTLQHLEANLRALDDEATYTVANHGLEGDVVQRLTQ